MCNLYHNDFDCRLNEMDQDAYPDYSDIHDVYSLLMSRVEYQSGYYSMTLQSLSGRNVVFNDIVHWSKAQELVEQFENEYSIVDLQDIP